jgi:hypothetical protein|tara:strand:+ start:842 stop:1054 length:213 start_codon:yes stop_codon:yes gene_type:complete
MVKEKFYDLLQELIEYEVKDILREDRQELGNRTLTTLATMEKAIENVDNRLGDVERRLATLSRLVYNDGK